MRKRRQRNRRSDADDYRLNDGDVQARWSTLGQPVTVSVFERARRRVVAWLSRRVTEPPPLFQGPASVECTNCPNRYIPTNGVSSTLYYLPQE